MGTQAPHRVISTLKPWVSLTAQYSGEWGARDLEEIAFPSVLARKVETNLLQVL